MIGSLEIGNGAEAAAHFAAFECRSSAAHFISQTNLGKEAFEELREAQRASEKAHERNDED
eukprot:11612510-Karenia_brevis.AAC.1